MKNTFERSYLFGGVAASGTQFSEWVDITENTEYGIIISHPGPGTSTTYSMQVSNNNIADIQAGIDVPADYPLYDLATGVVLPQKTSAEDFPIVVRPPFGRFRLKAVTAAGSGPLRAWLVAKPVNHG